MSSELAISVRDVSKVYRIYDKPEHRLFQMATLGRVRPFTEFAALHDISLDVRRGETIGIVGRNGCGKSTLLQIICGTLQPSKGHVEVSGRIAALLELGAGFNGEFTGRENAYMNGAILGFSREEMDARFDDIARFAAIGDFIERPVKTYSSGMFVRLAFAVATAVEPDILVVDEALAVGDEAFQRKCFARIEEIKERGGAILFVTHAAQTIVQLCDRGVLLDAGEKLLDGDPRLVVSHYQRLVNASSEGVPAIRREIAEVARASSSGANMSPERKEQVLLDAIRAEVDPDMPAPAAEMHADDGLEEFFDAALQSQSVVELEQRGAAIRSIRITTLEGRPVNVLRMGRRYLIEYQVHFSEDAYDVGFGMWIRTVEGLGLGGVQTINSKRHRIPSILKGSECRVTVGFTCSLVPGTYFVNSGIFATINGEFVVAHRIIDAIMLRVMPEADLISAGRVDFQPEVRIDVFPLASAS